MLNSVSQIAWRIVSRDPSGLILRECVQHMRIGEQIGGRLTPSLFVRPPRLGSMCRNVENTPL
jgi:hypothetical protein